MQGRDARVAWVAGAAGFIGPHVAARLERDGWRVIRIDRVQVPDASGVVGEIAPPVLDEAARRAGAPALVFHATGAGTVGASARDPAGSRRDTVASVETVVGWLRVHAPSALFILPSSAAVYGNAGARPLSEDTPLAPISVYGHHKMDAERAALAAAEHGLRVAILRLFSVYGPGLRKQLPWELSRKLLANPARLELFGAGDETRDYFAVSDVAELVAFLARGTVSMPLVVNGGTGVPTHIAAFAAAFAKAWGAAPEIAFNGEARAEDPRHLYADTSRLTALGFAPQGQLQQGLRAYVAWLREA
jgi:UDP-glucose 4-epimerase